MSNDSSIILLSILLIITLLTIGQRSLLNHTLKRIDAQTEVLVMKIESLERKLGEVPIQDNREFIIIPRVPPSI